MPRVVDTLRTVLHALAWHRQKAKLGLLVLMSAASAVPTASAAPSDAARVASMLRASDKVRRWDGTLSPDHRRYYLAHMLGLADDGSFNPGTLTEASMRSLARHLLEVGRSSGPLTVAALIHDAVDALAGAKGLSAEAVQVLMAAAALHPSAPVESPPPPADPIAPTRVIQTWPTYPAPEVRASPGGTIADAVERALANRPDRRFQSGSTPPPGFADALEYELGEMRKLGPLDGPAIEVAVSRALRAAENASRAPASQEPSDLERDDRIPAWSPPGPAAPTEVPVPSFETPDSAAGTWGAGDDVDRLEAARRALMERLVLGITERRFGSDAVGPPGAPAYPEPEVASPTPRRPTTPEEILAARIARLPPDHQRLHRVMVEKYRGRTPTEIEELVRQQLYQDKNITRFTPKGEVTAVDAAVAGKVRNVLAAFQRLGLAADGSVVGDPAE